MWIQSPNGGNSQQALWLLKKLRKKKKEKSPIFTRVNEIIQTQQVHMLISR